MKKIDINRLDSSTEWVDWRWQQQNALTHKDELISFFPNISQKEIQVFERYRLKYKLKMTPYILSLIDKDSQGNPLENDPIWRQFSYLDEGIAEDSYESDSAEENWENPDEMPTKILQHKYPDRAIIRVTDICFGHCNYCYLTSRVLDQKQSKTKVGKEDDWNRSMAYLRANTQIRDVLISGGDPLIFDNNKIRDMLKDLRSIEHIQTIRLNTRVLTFNPYRVDQELVEIFKTYQLTALEIHLCHYKELTDVVDERLALFDSGGYRPMILWRAPLLRGINDTQEVMDTLLMALYKRRITPYYLFHYAPFTLGRSKQGVKLKEGATMMENLRRQVPGPAFPRFTLFHIEGKQDIPLGKESNFVYESINGRSVARFINWKGNEVIYPDVN